jgi:hypothetical protein
MTKNERKAELVRRGIRAKDIIAHMKPRPVKPNTVYVVLNGHQQSRPIQEAVADLLGIPFEEVWEKAA